MTLRSSPSRAAVYRGPLDALGRTACSGRVRELVKGREFDALDQALHVADEALRRVPMQSVAQVQAALLLMDHAGRLASASFPSLAMLIRRAEEAVVGQGKAAAMNPEQRRALARGYLERVFLQLHLERPHPGASRLN